MLYSSTIVLLVVLEYYDDILGVLEYCLENATDVVCNPKGSVEERISVLEYFIVLGCRICVACTRRGLVRICNYDAC